MSYEQRLIYMVNRNARRWRAVRERNRRRRQRNLGVSTLVISTLPLFSLWNPYAPKEQIVPVKPEQRIVQRVEDAPSIDGLVEAPVKVPERKLPKEPEQKNPWYRPIHSAPSRGGYKPRKPTIEYKPKPHSESHIPKNHSPKKPRNIYERIVAEWKPVVDYATEKFPGVEPSLMYAVIYAESRGNEDAVSHRGAIGPVQLMPRTARRELGVNPWDPVANVSGGAKYLEGLLERFNERLDLSLAAYNAGPTRVARRGIPPYKETQRYIWRVKKASLEFARILGDNSWDERVLGTK